MVALERVILIGDLDKKNERSMISLTRVPSFKSSNMSP